MKKIPLVVAACAGMVFAVFVAKTVFAQNSTVESDFARDVKLGGAELKNDPEALQAQQDVDAAEDVEAHIDTIEVITQTALQPEEAVEPTTELLPPDAEITITPEPEPEVPPEQVPQETPSPTAAEMPAEIPPP